MHIHKQFQSPIRIKINGFWILLFMSKSLDRVWNLNFLARRFATETLGTIQQWEEKENTNLWLLMQDKRVSNIDVTPDIKWCVNLKICTLKKWGHPKKN